MSTWVYMFGEVSYYRKAYKSIKFFSPPSSSGKFPLKLLEDSILQGQVLQQNRQINIREKKITSIHEQSIHLKKKKSYKVTHKVSKLTNFPSSEGSVPENWFASRFLRKEFAIQFVSKFFCPHVQNVVFHGKCVQEVIEAH